MYKKKKRHIVTKEEIDWVNKMLESSRRWRKPYKGEVVIMKDGCSQEFVFKFGCSSKEELMSRAEAKVEEMKALSKDKTWKLMLARLVGQTIDDEDKE